MRRLALLLGLGLLACGWKRRRPRVLLPQGRTSYRCDEAFEVAVAGLPAGAPAVLALEPRSGAATPVSSPLRGDGRTIVVRFEPGLLAPATYALTLDGRRAGQLTIASGVKRSPLLMSRHKKPSASMTILSADCFGRLDERSRPRLGGAPSAGMQRLDAAVARDLPVVVYTYWTGWVTHHPFGEAVSWCAPATRTAMRLSSLHTAQRLRRFGRSVVGVGAIDEPSLGDPPAWDEAAWYEDLGGSTCAHRVETLRRIMAEAREDLRTVWPEVSFRTDLWAPERRRNGCDPLLQAVNDVPTTHAFPDQGWGRAGLVGALAVARAVRPADKLAYAANGQLSGPPASHTATRDAFLLTRNLLLGAGIRSSWWLNEQPLEPLDLDWLDAPALRLGGLFDAMAPRVPDIAVLWSARAAEAGDGRAYYDAIVTLVSAVYRAGHAARVVHEDRVAEGGEVLLVCGAVAAPAGLEAWRVVAADEASRPLLPAATLPLPWRAPPRWAPLARVTDGVSARTAAYLQTTHCMDAPTVAQVPTLRAFLSTLGVSPALHTDSVHLMALEQHAGDCALTVLVNTYEEMPADETCGLYNHASHTATVALPRQAVCIEGPSWDRVRRLDGGTHALTFAAGEAKLLLSIPRTPSRLTVDARYADGWLEVEARLDVDAVWPLQVRLDAGPPLHRATDPRGRYRERLPRGTNVSAPWVVEVKDLLGDLSATATGAGAGPRRARLVEVPVQVFDEAAILNLLKTQPALTIACDTSSEGRALASALRRLGLAAVWAPQRSLARRALYPRVWPATIVIHEARGRIDARCTVETDADGRVRVRHRLGGHTSPRKGELVQVAGEGLAIAADLLFVEPGAIVRWTGSRWVPFETRPVEVRTEAAVRARWARPWRALSSYRGDDRVPPQLPEAYAVDGHLLLLGAGELSRALAASELLPRDVQPGWPGPGRAALFLAWSPFVLGRDVIYLAADDAAGRARGASRLLSLVESALHLVG